MRPATASNSDFCVSTQAAAEAKGNESTFGWAGFEAEVSLVALGSPVHAVEVAKSMAARPNPVATPFRPGISEVSARLGSSPSQLVADS
jgi:hypothetical protein